MPKYYFKDFEFVIQNMIGASGLRVENGNFIARANESIQSVMKKAFIKCKEYYLDETRYPAARKELIRKVVDSAKVTIASEKAKIRAELSKVLYAARESAMKPVGEKTELDIFRREMKEQELRQHIRLNYANDPIKMQAELGAILEKDKLWASASLNDPTGQIQKSMNDAGINLEESFMQSNNPLGYDGLQEARSIDSLATNLFNMTDTHLDKLTNSEFETGVDTKAQSELAALTEQIKEDMQAKQAD
jgi:hypothetical protein